MTGMKGKFMLLNAMAAMAAMGEGGFSSSVDHLDLSEGKVIPKKPVIQPKGTKEYKFDEWGNFSTTGDLKTTVVFTCFAINDKNAIRKFNNTPLRGI